MRIEFIDRDSINSRCLPADDESAPTKEYILSLVKNGPGWYVDNVQAQMMALVLDDSLIPLVIAEKKQQRFRCMLSPFPLREIHN